LNQAVLRGDFFAGKKSSVDVMYGQILHEKNHAASGGEVSELENAISVSLAQYITPPLALTRLY